MMRQWPFAYEFIARALAAFEASAELNPFTDMGPGLTNQEKTDLINFMKTLTDGYMQASSRPPDRTALYSVAIHMALA